ncbi:ATP-binding protein [Alkalilacustris brevis]|uniref:ATP-binding protein n=1 Tax=Alkalilacustris brevis TaxID=2026338 RepID=UPI000E0D6AB2|nr:ATP-binding protein [Alkalilacustris brevis]
MVFRWLKRFMPTGLYGRAALILILPIVTMQLVVSVLFIQRHYEGVTERMTSNIAVGLRYLLDAVDEAETVAAAQAEIVALQGPLDLQTELPAGAPPPPRDLREAVDLTGRVIALTLRAELPGVRGIDMISGRNEAHVWVETRHGMMILYLDRTRLTVRNPHQLLVIVIFTGTLMTLIAFLFLRNQLRPIKRLADAAEAFGKGRSVDYRPQGAREVRAAGQAFLEMRGRLERQIEQRTLMLSAVSHDLRTPLTRLRLGLALQPGDPEAKAMLADIDEMERLVDMFLAYARGDAVADPVLADPVALVRGAVETAHRAGQEVRLVDVRGEGAEMPMRPQLLARALDNLIGNATRYGSRAEIGVALLPDALHITVEDDGPGIPEGQRGDALKPFIRLDSARNQNSGAGVGLGLAIVADAVRGHGGRLTLGESTRLGGLKAEIILPR